MALLKINEKYVKQAVFAVTVLFLIAEALFFAPITIPHKLCLPVGVLVLSSLWLTPWEIFFALLFSVLGDYAGTCKIFLLQDRAHSNLCELIFQDSELALDGFYQGSNFR